MTDTAAPDALPATVPLPPQARAELAEAIRTLENPSLAARLAALAGTPVEAIKNRLPTVIQAGLESAVRTAVHGAWRAAERSRPGTTPGGVAPDWFHRGLAAATGAAGGALGLAGTIVELPVSTTILLRQIASEARDAGEDPSDPETRAECLKVFALGGDAAADDDYAQAGYYAARVALAQFVPNAAANLAAVAFPGLIGAVASRFTGTVGLKLSAQSVPVIGAAAGAAVNLAFLEHFRAVARAHFAVRRLERTYGAGPVRDAYDALRDERMATDARRAKAAADAYAA